VVLSVSLLPLVTSVSLRLSRECRLSSPVSFETFQLTLCFLGLISIGAITAIASNLATRLKFIIRVDESLDVYALHGVGGAVGCAMTALFGSASIVSSPWP
jgi:hypothetical protein